MRSRPARWRKRCSPCGRSTKDLVDAQQARRVIDRLVGYKLSPLLWKKIRKGLSAGRVQSVAVRLVCEREEEIDKFIPVESWSLDAMLNKHDLRERVFAARFIGKQGEDKTELKEEPQVREIMAHLEGAAYRVLSIDTKDTMRNSPPPYKTSTLQQDASNRLRMKPNSRHESCPAALRRDRSWVTRDRSA